MNVLFECFSNVHIKLLRSVELLCLFCLFLESITILVLFLFFSMFVISPKAIQATMNSLLIDFSVVLDCFQTQTFRHFSVLTF